MPKYLITLDGKYMDGWKDCYRRGDDPKEAKWAETPEQVTMGLTVKTSAWALRQLRELNAAWKQATITMVPDAPEEKADGLHEDGQPVHKEHRARKPRVDKQSS